MPSAGQRTMLGGLSTEYSTDGAAAFHFQVLEKTALLGIDVQTAVMSGDKF